MEGLVLILIADLMEDRDLRFHFNRNPERVMKLYRLPESAKQCVRTMERDNLAKQIASELDLWGFPDDGFPAHEPVDGQLHYPDPDPEIIDVLYSGGEVTVLGQSLKFKHLKKGGNAPQDEMIMLEYWKEGDIVDGKKAWKPFSSVTIHGTYRATRLKGAFPSNPAPGDKYSIRAVLNPVLKAPHDHRKEVEWKKVLTT